MISPNVLIGSQSSSSSSTTTTSSTQATTASTTSPVIASTSTSSVTPVVVLVPSSDSSSSSSSSSSSTSASSSSAPSTDSNAASGDSAASTAAAAATKEKKEKKEKKESKEEVKVSNVPSVSNDPEFINKQEADAKSASIIPHHLRPRLSGSTLVTIPHMYDSSRPTIQREISNDDLQFDLKPSYLGPAGQEFVYYNAQDVAWYAQRLPNPIMTIWILIKNTSFVLNTANNVGYVKRRLVEEAIRQNIQIHLMNPNLFDLAVSKRGMGEVNYGGESFPLPECVIPRVGANVDYFGLAVLRQLESLGIHVFNPVSAIEISRDKLYTHQVLSTNGIPIPKTVLSKMPFDYEYIEKQFGGYPVIVKMASGSRGEAVWKVNSKKDMEELISKIDKTKPLIIQEFLADTKGRDLRCLVVGDRVVGSCMRVAGSGFKANFHQGGSVNAVSIDQPLHDMVVRTAKLCGLTFSGVDVLLDTNSYKICEVNSSPGFEGVERASEVNCGLAMVNHVRDFVFKRRAEPSRRRSVSERVYPLQQDHVDAYEEVLKVREEQKKAQKEKEAKEAQEKAEKEKQGEGEKKEEKSGEVGVAAAATTTPATETAATS